MITNNVSNISNDYSVGTKTIPINENEFNISCFVKDGNDELINITLYAGSKENAKNIFLNWENNSNEIYKNLIKILTMPNDEDYTNVQANSINASNGYEVGTNITQTKKDEYKVLCFIQNKTEDIINISLYAGSKEHAINISLNFQEYYREIYDKLITMITKENMKKESTI